MRTLVYKRTHVGDPRAGGVFGVEDCMGRVRGYGFDNVIGIGGVGAWARSQGIDRRLNWIGVGAHVVGELQGSPLIAFRNFRLYESKGDLLEDVAPHLARRFCHSKAPRFALDTFSRAERDEIERLLARIKNSPPSSGDLDLLSKSECRTACKPKRQC